MMGGDELRFSSVLTIKRIINTEEILNTHHPSTNTQLSINTQHLTPNIQHQTPNNPHE